MSLGWYRSFLPVAQAYSGPASPYWASKAFLGLLLPADHAVWTAPEEPGPVETADRCLALPAPGWLLHSTAADGIVRLVNHGSGRLPPPPTPPQDSPHYTRFAYSTAAAPETPPDDESPGPDNHIALLGSSGPSRRGRIHPLYVHGRQAASWHTPLAGLVIAVALALGALYRWTRFGLATRAASENEQAALLAGLSPNSVSLANTLLSALIAGLLGVLAAPIVQVDSVTLPLQVVPALAAALFAGFTSLWIACSAGILIGVMQSVVYYLSTQSWFPTDNGNAMPGLQQLLIFILMIIALYVKGAGLPRRGELVEQRLPAVPLPDRLLRPAVLATAAAALALIVLPFDFRQALTNSLIGAIIVLSYVVITGYVGQISVMQLALSGTAGFVLSHLATGLHIPFPFNALGATLLATLLGVAAGISALRVRGVSLAVVTLAAALAMEQALFTNTSFGGTAGVTVLPPRLFGVDLGPGAAFRGLDGNEPSPLFGFLVLSVAVALGLYVANLRRTGLGRRMLAVRSNERAAAAAGVNVRGVKIAAFAVSSFIASAAGTLYGYNFGSVSAVRFTALAALGLIGFAYIGGITMVSGAVIAGLMSTEALIPHALDKWFGIKGSWALLFGGISLIVTLIANPDGIAGANHRRKKAKTAARAAKTAQALAENATSDTAGAETAPAPEEVAR
ncbi:leucine/isoleucine/valine transporter permease subunit [Streptomyces jeddahensis]|uniref:Leucine/isoleucine/valine transporter permease subunit n=1 Tax=Streptomyces jeddahensis TaxID=1716141 RepID=A0A177HG60_9ACTN|nr:leucine/isoleucine/valine transporter permease subunit [Streptomyces jeddahensis]